MATRETIEVIIINTAEAPLTIREAIGITIMKAISLIAEAPKEILTGLLQEEATVVAVQMRKVEVVVDLTIIISLIQDTNKTIETTKVLDTITTKDVTTLM